MIGKERPEPTAPFEFTQRERLNDKLSDARFRALLADERTIVHVAEMSSNSYGEFLFVSVSRPGEEKPTHLTFYGYGYHDHRERWITETWSWYEAMETPKLREKQISREEVEQILNNRQAEIKPHLSEDTQTKRGLLYELLAEMTDEDGAISELEDLGDAADWLLGEDDSE